MQAGGSPCVTLPDRSVEADGLKPNEVIPDGFTVRTDFAGVLHGPAHPDGFMAQTDDFVPDGCTVRSDQTKARNLRVSGRLC